MAITTSGVLWAAEGLGEQPHWAAEGATLKERPSPFSIGLDGAALASYQAAIAAVRRVGEVTEEDAEPAINAMTTRYRALMTAAEEAANSELVALHLTRDDAQEFVRLWHGFQSARSRCNCEADFREPSVEHPSTRDQADRE